MEKCSFLDIRVGDILMLNQGEIAPCDLLILATSEVLNGKQVCQMDTYCDNGKSLREEKDAVTLTRQINHWTEDHKTIWYFLIRLTGKISYQTNSVLDTITGNLKLKSDPKVELFDDNKVVKRGSILKSTYIVGLVLFNSQSNFRIMRTNLFPKNSKIESDVRNYIIILVVMIIIFGILQSLFHSRIHEETSKSYFRAGGIASHISNGLSIFPFGLLLIINPVLFINSLILKKKYKNLIEDNVNSSKVLKEHANLSRGRTQSIVIFPHQIFDPRLEVISPFVIPDLGDIDDAFFDKTGTLSSNSYEVKSIAINEKIYLSQSKNFLVAELLEQRHMLDHKKLSQFESFGKPDIAFLEQPVAITGVNENEIASERIYIPTIQKSHFFPVREDGNSIQKEKSPSPGHDLPIPREFWSPSNKSGGVPFSRLESLSKREGSRLPAVSPGDPNTLSDKKPRLIKNLQNDVSNELDFYIDYQNSQKMQNFMKLFALCHNCKATYSGFEGNSMEEKALLALALEYGVQLISAPELEDEAQPDKYNVFYSLTDHFDRIEDHFVYLIINSDRSNF